jgi:hypothetical protein
MALIGIYRITVGKDEYAGQAISELFDDPQISQRVLRTRPLT